MMFKRIIMTAALFAALFAAAAFVQAPAFGGVQQEAYAASAVKSGTCGDNLTWTFDSEGTLTISGTGEMGDFHYYDSPWDGMENDVKTVIIKSGVTTIGDSAFMGFVNLTQVTIPDTVVKIDNRVFCRCSSLKNVTIPGSVETIGYNAFLECSSLTSIKIPEGVKSIDSYAFGYCSGLTKITIPDSVKTIDSAAFSNCTSLKSIVLPDSVDVINDDLLRNCTSLTSVKLGRYVTTIGGCAFCDCTSLTNIALPEWTETIGYFAFSGCSSLKSITIGKKVSEICGSAFEDCNALSDVYYTGTKTEWNGISIDTENSCLTKATLNCITPVTITKQPTHASAVSGGTVTTSVTAAGEGLTYQWYIRDKNDAKYYKSSITDRTYTLKMTEEKSGRAAYCIVTDKYGNTAKSDWVLLNLLEITEQPKSSAGGRGTPLTATVTVKGEPSISYQWYICEDGKTTFNKSSIIDKTYSFRMSEEKSGRRAYCIVTDKNGNKIQSDTVTFSLIEITKQPANAVAAEGKVISTSVASLGTDLKYQWYVCEAGKSTFTKSSITSDTYSFKMTAEKSGRKVYCVVTDKYGNSVKSDTATLTCSNIIISFNANGGSGAPAEQAKQKNVNLTLPTTVPTRLKYNFLGWSTVQNAAAAEYLPGGSFAGNTSTTLYAVWKGPKSISSTLTSASYKASIPFASACEYYKFKPETSGKYRFESSGDMDTRIYLYNPSGEQLAWSDDHGEGSNFCLTYDFKAGATYYLKVSIYQGGKGTVNFTGKRIYTIKFNANGGENAPETQLKKYGTALTLSTQKPTRAGYTFLGWSSDKTATAPKYTAGGSFTVNSNASLYAVWQANSELKITGQPASASAAAGETVSTKVIAEGDGLTYTWHVCDVGNRTFVKSSITKSTYAFTMTAAKNGRKVYCIVKDSNGNSVRSKTVTFTME